MADHDSFSCLICTAACTPKFTVKNDGNLIKVKCKSEDNQPGSGDGMKQLFEQKISVEFIVGNLLGVPNTKWSDQLSKLNGESTGDLALSLCDACETLIQLCYRWSDQLMITNKLLSNARKRLVYKVIDSEIESLLDFGGHAFWKLIRNEVYFGGVKPPTSTYTDTKGNSDIPGPSDSVISWARSSYVANENDTASFSPPSPSNHSKEEDDHSDEDEVEILPTPVKPPPDVVTIAEDSDSDDDKDENKTKRKGKPKKSSKSRRVSSSSRKSKDTQPSSSKSRAPDKEKATVPSPPLPPTPNANLSSARWAEVRAPPMLITPPHLVVTSKSKPTAKAKTPARAKSGTKPSKLTKSASTTKPKAKGDASQKLTNKPKKSTRRTDEKQPSKKSSVSCPTPTAVSKPVKSVKKRIIDSGAVYNSPLSAHAQPPVVPEPVIHSCQAKSLSPPLQVYRSEPIYKPKPSRSAQRIHTAPKPGPSRPQQSGPSRSPKPGPSRTRPFRQGPSRPFTPRVPVHKRVPFRPNHRTRTHTHVPGPSNYSNRKPKRYRLTQYELSFFSQRLISTFRYTPVYKCALKGCNAFYDTYNNYLDHTYLHKNNSVVSICHLCGWHMRPYKMQTHMTFAHEFLPPPPQTFEIRPFEVRQVTPVDVQYFPGVVATHYFGMTIFKCRLCPRFFPSESHFVSSGHCQLHSIHLFNSTTCSICGWVLRKDEVMQHNHEFHLGQGLLWN